MKAFIFAAGRGTRMHPLSAQCPKPLLPVAGTPLIAWHLNKLASMGISQVVINLSWLAETVIDRLGDGKQFGLKITYSQEGAIPLETGGGLLNALEQLGPSPFLVINGDIWTDYDFSQLPQQPKGLAHLVLVAPPGHAPDGDWHLGAEGQLVNNGPRPLTYAGIGVYRPQLFDHWPEAFKQVPSELSWVAGKPQFRLATLLSHFIQAGRVYGEYYRGQWTDVGTPERLTLLDQRLRAAGIRAR